MALTDPELRDWLENLANTNAERRRIIVDLLRHKGEDHMSSEDITDCLKAIEWLDAEDIPERPGPIRLSADTALTEVEH
jgi:hypothetical protein